MVSCWAWSDDERKDDGRTKSRRQRRMNLIEAVGASVFQRWTRIDDESKTTYCRSIPPRQRSVVYELDVITMTGRRALRRSMVVKDDLNISER